MLGRPDVDPDRASFSIALNAARDQLITAMGVLTDTAPNTVIDLVGELGRQVLAHLMPGRRARTNPRVVKRAISVYAANTARGRVRWLPCHPPSPAEPDRCRRLPHRGREQPGGR